MASRDRDITVDLESGGTTSEEEGSKEPVSGGRQARKVLSRVWSGFLSFDGSIKGEGGMSSCTASNSVDVLTENPESSTDKKSGGEETMGLLEKKMVKEKHKKTSSKKPPKPPRPPRGPSLDAADLKLVRDISELAMLKRTRIERMKELKKKKAAKATSSNSSLCAMVVTILFFLIIIFQGKNGKRKSRNVAPESGGVSESHAERAMYSRSSSSVSFQGSPKSTVGLISAQYYKNRSASDTNGTEYGSPNFVEQISWSSGSQEEVSRAAG